MDEEKDIIKEVSRSFGISFLEAEIAGLLAVGGKYTDQESVEYAKVIVEMMVNRLTRREPDASPVT